MNDISTNPTTDDTTMNQNDQILESLRPRMHAARVAHVRRLALGVAVVPLLGFGAVAMAADGDSSPELETAGAVEEPDVDEVDTREEAEEAPGDTGQEDEPAEDMVTEDDLEPVPTTTTAAPDPDAPRALELGALGWVEVEPAEDAFAVLSYDLSEGWEVLNAEVVDGKLTILLSNSEIMKVVVITPGPRDEILVSVDDFVIPTTTTTVKPVEPEKDHEEHEEPKPAPIVDRFTVEVPGKGSFVVEREGETLYVGNVTANEGYASEIHKAEGWKVIVGFSNGEVVSFGKALINDAGEVETHVWDEEIGPVPVHQWVEIPEIGAAKFEVLENQIRVVKTETAEGFGSWDYNQGAWAGTAKVDFEGEGQIWFIEAWINESGELAWSTYQG